MKYKEKFLDTQWQNTPFHKQKNVSSHSLPFEFQFYISFETIY